MAADCSNRRSQGPHAAELGSPAGRVASLRHGPDAHRHGSSGVGSEHQSHFFLPSVGQLHDAGSRSSRPFRRSPHCSRRQDDGIHRLPRRRPDTSRPHPRSSRRQGLAESHRRQHRSSHRRLSMDQGRRTACRYGRWIPEQICSVHSKWRAASPRRADFDQFLVRSPSPIRAKSFL